MNNLIESVLVNLLGFLFGLGLLVSFLFLFERLRARYWLRLEAFRAAIPWQRYNSRTGLKQFKEMVLQAQTYTKIVISVGGKDRYWIRVDPSAPIFEVYFVTHEVTYLTWVAKVDLLHKTGETKSVYGALVLLLGIRTKSQQFHLVESLPK